MPLINNYCSCQLWHDSIVKLITDDLSVQELSRIATSLGQSQRSVFKDDGDKFTGGQDEVKSFKETTFLEAVNPIVFKFITVLTCQATISANKLNIVCVSIDNIFQCANFNFIGPTSFTINLLVYILSGSEKH